MFMRPWRSAARDDAAEQLSETEQQINKRLTLNLLIQGAGAHTFLSAHHLVRDELDALRPGLTRLYDRTIISAHLSYWIGDIALVCGFPFWFWRRTHKAWHPFHRHRLLACHGGMLSRESKKYLTRRGWRKWVICIPVLHYIQCLWLVLRVARAERGIKEPLARLAERATAEIWGIDESRLDGRLTQETAFGNIRTARTFRGECMRSCAIGWGGVERRRNRFTVVGKAWFWPLLSHELTKGVAELICLHGLNDLDDETYDKVMHEADQIEFEVWMLQAGAEMWRRLLAMLPADRPLPEMLMHIARLDPQALERLMLAVIEDPQRSKQMLHRLGE